MPEKQNFLTDVFGFLEFRFEQRELTVKAFCMTPNGEIKLPDIILRPWILETRWNGNVYNEFSFN